ncbi:MAG: hypothetical protein H3C47_12180 [Candidatus Cloacimonetes bacterium]|nr:hypothetical protein [Candidatus Cloacimonadota bacterium]
MFTISSATQSWVSQQSSKIVSLSFVAKDIREWEKLYSNIRKANNQDNIRPLLNLTRFYILLAQEKPIDSIMAGNQALQSGLEIHASPVAFEAFLYALNAVAQNTSSGYMVPQEWRFDLVDWYLPAGSDIMPILSGNPDQNNPARAQAALQQAYLNPECREPRILWLADQSRLPESPKKSVSGTCLPLLETAIQNSISHFTALVSREWAALILSSDNRIPEAITMAEGAHIFLEHPRVHTLSTLLHLNQKNFKLAEYHKSRALQLDNSRTINFPEPAISAVITPDEPQENQDKWGSIRAKLASVSSMIKATESTPAAKTSETSKAPARIETQAPEVIQFDESKIPAPGTLEWASFLKVEAETHKDQIPKALMEHLLVWHLNTIQRVELIELLGVAGHGRIQNPILLEFLDRMMLSEARPLDLARRYSLWLRIAQRLPAELLERLQIRLIVWQSLLGAPALKLDHAEQEILGSLASNGLLGVVFKSLQQSAVTSR